MALYEVSINLSSSIVPFATELWGRTVMFPQLDENYNRTIFSTIDPGFEKGVPQVYYMHNVMPTVLGYQSVGYDTLSGNATNDPEVVLDSIFQIQTPNQNNFLFSPASGKNFLYNGSWQQTTTFAPGLVNPNTLITTAFVQGQTYIYFANIGCYVYDDITNTFTSVVLAGLDPTQVKGICAANGYMIAVSDNAAAWSSISDPTDFVPSLVTGAGGGSINDAKGTIIVALQISGGFIIYCQYNAVGATYTGNSNFPFILLEVANSGGILSNEQVTYHSNKSTHIAYGSFGLQEINKSTAKGIYTEASDFLASNIIEDFDEALLTFTTTYTVRQLATKLSIIMGRYLIISYGETFLRYTHALVYDMEFKRYGKLKIEHTDCFEWNDPHVTAPTDVVISKVFPKKSIVFCQEKGRLLMVNFDYGEQGANGVCLFGKYQFRRGNFITHQYGILDGTPNNAGIKYVILRTINGKDFLPPAFGRRNSKLSGIKSTYFQRLSSGANISILINGGFNLTSLIFGFTTDGKR